MGAKLIHRMFDPPHRDIRSVSFVALKRSNRGVLELPVSTGGDKVLANHRVDCRLYTVGDPRALEHLDTDSIVDSKSPPRHESWSSRSGDHVEDLTVDV